MCLCEYVSDVPQRKSTRGERRGATIDGEGGVRKDKKAVTKSIQERFLIFASSHHKKYNNKPFTVQGFEDYKMIQMKIF